MHLRCRVVRKQLVWTRLTSFANLRGMNRLRALPLLIALACLLAGGCARMKMSKFDLSGLRDPRAADIDGRLSAPVANDRTLE